MNVKLHIGAGPGGGARIRAAGAAGGVGRAGGLRHRGVGAGAMSPTHYDVAGTVAMLTILACGLGYE